MTGSLAGEKESGQCEYTARAGKIREEMRRIMKKRSVVVWMAAVLAAGMLTGCGNAEDPESGQDSLGLNTQPIAQGGTSGAENTPGSDESTGQPSQGEAKGYQFKVGDAVLAPDMDMDAVLPQLSEAKSVFEAPSCAGQGIGYTYDFGSFKVETYPNEGVNHIAYIMLQNDTVSTMEGIDLSMTREDIIAAYGDGYEETEKGLIYEKDGMKLKFIFEGDAIVSIEYASAVVG